MRILLILLFATLALHANPDLFREGFADPATRTAAIATLTPGTRDHFFFIALDHQLNGREKEYADTITAWKAASKTSKNPIPDSGLATLENRRILLAYDKDPKAALTELSRVLDLKFDATKPDSAAANKALPTVLDPALISPTAFQKITEQSNPREPYIFYSPALLFTELDSLPTFSPERIRWFAEHARCTHHPRFTELLGKALALKPPIDADRIDYSSLSLSRLDELKKSTPALLSNTAFNKAYLTKLTPAYPAQLDRHPEAHAAFLAACKDHVLTLPSTQNSLKAHILYQHLRLQEIIGNHPLDDLLAYLALPRQSHPIIVPTKESDHYPAPDSDSSKITLCPDNVPGDDSPLIESYLFHFLKDSDTAQKPFVPFIQEKRLDVLHAQARLLAGADPALWAAALTPDAYKSLREETRISFAPSVHEIFSADEKVSLPLDLKNTPSLLIRIFAIDAKEGDSAGTLLELDGLVPHHIRSVTFPQAPLVLHRETLDLPELSGAGTWIVEFVSDRISARALIRKGNLTPYLSRTPAGQIVRLFDEKAKPVANFTLTLGDETFTSKEGSLTVANAPNQPVTEGTLTAGNLVTNIALEDRGDSFELESSFLLDREQLLADLKTTLHLRTRLTNHGQPAPLEKLENPTLVLKARLLGGVTTERTLADPLALAATNDIPILIPADLLSLTLTLSGTVTLPTTGEKKTLTATETYQLNGALQSSRIATALFSPTSTGHRLSLRGRNGEPLPDRPITLNLGHKLYQKPITTYLRTDASGTIELGKLEGIASLTASSSDIEDTSYIPPARKLSIPSRYNIPADRELRIPLLRPLEKPDPSRIQFRQVLDTEIQEGIVTQDLYSRLKFTDRQIVISGLAPGDYDLLQDSIIQARITVLPADSVRGDLLVTSDRILPLTAPATPTIASAKVEGGTLAVRIADATPETRVTLIAKRYQIRGWDAGDAPYPFALGLPDDLTRAIRPSRFLTERRLSDEMRYILDRRNAKTFPGSMLPRPGLLLNRWTAEDVDQENQKGRDQGDGATGQGLGRGGDSRPTAGNKRQGRDSSFSHPSVIDFLQVPAAVSFNLTPAADGTVSVPLANFLGAQFVEIIAADTEASDKTYLPLPPSETPLRDRRIARPLDPKAHHIATRFAAALGAGAGAEAKIENLLDADWRAFTTLGEAHQFLLATTGDDRLRTFNFLTTWPTLDEKQKLILLAEHHCHELHLFLSRKDPIFFDAHVKPFLAAKPEPKFIDDYLLKRDLIPYLRPYAFSQLNAAEKALLAQAIPASRKDISRELDFRWKHIAPSPEAETILFSQTLKGADLSPNDSLGLVEKKPGANFLNGVSAASGEEDQADRGVGYITNKLRSIIIPQINFEDITVEEAIDFLRLRAAELDKTTTDPTEKGVSFIIRRPNKAAAGAADPGLDAGAAAPLGRGAEPGALRIKELRLRNVPLGVALKYICDATKLRYKADEFAISIVPQTETTEDLLTRSFLVPPDFAASLAGGLGGGEVDPFASGSDNGAAKLTARRPIAELLKASGIAFPPGSSASLSADGTLLVTGTPTELDKVEQLTSMRKSVSDPFAAPESLEEAGRTLLFPDSTRLWLESNYYKHRGETDESLIPLNRFWLELSAWDGKGGFTSPHFNACTHSAADALMCLALLDLPFTAEKPEVAVEDSTLRVKARAPMLLFYKDTRRTEKLAADSPLLLRQSYHPLGEPFLTDAQGRRIENTVTGSFRTGVPYGLSLVITNPTGTERRIETLAQIPAGAIPLATNRNQVPTTEFGVLPPIPSAEDMHAPETLSTSHQLAPYGVVQLQLAFYFPAPGDYAAYPFHVSENDTVLAHAAPRTLRVSADPAPEDSASWSVIARDGTDDAVLNQLSTADLATIKLGDILWRLRDRDFFLKATGILRKRLCNPTSIFSYAVLHDDPATLPDFIENTSLGKNLGQWFSSKLISITPAVHHGWQTMEFDPLVNPRSHPFGENPRLSHEEAHAHYLAFLDTLIWKPLLTSADRLTLAYFLFLQDRTGEALERFAEIKRADLTDPLQYDYFHTVALFHQGKPVEAKAIATPYLAKLPPGTWRDRFEAVSAQADEIAQPLAAVPAEKENTRASLEIQREGTDAAITLRHTNLSSAKIRLYQIDLEVLFSKDPFLKQGAGSALPPIAPNLVVDVPFEKGSASTTYPLPPNFRQGNILIAAESEDTKTLKILDSQQLETRINPADRSIQIIDPAAKVPLPGTYLKVYAESRDGTVTFHKDGYTDLRGKFDYLSHTAIDPSTIRRIAILVSHPEKGSLTRIINR